MNDALQRNTEREQTGFERCLKCKILCRKLEARRITFCPCDAYVVRLFKRPGDDKPPIRRTALLPHGGDRGKGGRSTAPAMSSLFGCVDGWFVGAALTVKLHTFRVHHTHSSAAIEYHTMRKTKYLFERCTIGFWTRRCYNHSLRRVVLEDAAFIF